MNHFVPCSGCARHVRATDSLCPFCGEALPLSLRQRAPRVPTKRLGRAATIAFGAALAASACSDGTGDDRDSGSMIDSGGGTHDSGSGDDDAGATMDSGSDEDAGTSDDAGSEDDAGTSDDAGTPEEDAGTDGGGIVPPYGTPAPRRDGGGVVPLYGGPPPA